LAGLQELREITAQTNCLIEGVRFTDGVASSDAAKTSAA
jgi:hypothetical protein